MIRTALAMIAFAANSLLCRIALGHTGIDPASFTTIRLAAGALVLGLIVRARRCGPADQAGRTRLDPGRWPSAIALFVYAAAFSLAYTRLTTATGALILFGSVQATMIGHDLLAGERLSLRQSVGVAIALAGLVGLLLPGLSAPPIGSAAAMLVAGVAWGVYSLRGRRGGDPTAVSAGNFLRATPIAVALSFVLHDAFALDLAGVLAATASGALASGLGYAIWYGVLPALGATRAAIVQLSVPILAALGGIVFLGERPTLRLALASTAILGGIALGIRKRA
ncbi:MAG: DMT family transporter [Myxococcota bacterium]